MGKCEEDVKGKPVVSMVHEAVLRSVLSYACCQSITEAVLPI